MLLTMVLQQALIFYPIALSVYLSYRVLKITDLSADGIYVFGAAVFARSLVWGPWGALLCTMLSGLLAGTVLSLMQRKNYVHHLIAGILMTFMLYSINFELMGRPNISLLGQPNLLKTHVFDSWLTILIVINILLALSISALLSSRWGLFMRAFGLQSDLLDRYGLNPEYYRWIGLMTGSLCTALSGSLFAQINGFVDLNMGAGVALIAIGSVLVGMKMTMIIKAKQYQPYIELMACFFGVFLYFGLLSALMRFGVQPVHLKFFIGLALYMSMRMHGFISRQQKHR